MWNILPEVADAKEDSEEERNDIVAVEFKIETKNLSLIWI